MASARTARRAAALRLGALALGALWWWAVLRLALEPGAGVLEGAVAVGGWGLSVLPVHCVPRRRAAGAVGAGRWRCALRGARGASPPSRCRSAVGLGPPGSGGP
ncbi:hypothetical protein [Streptomyces pactum]|uniref:Uncharacterized protein n=1 Tax=Streptomyces pactum TaxID=68249 RepID=A0A1S6J625_9ACTN|nr:hypothetical protein [Streptomyces pactum]AQS67212.1 hypothetical protein B1H29_09970 [Streptomyces pactum]